MLEKMEGRILLTTVVVPGAGANQSAWFVYQNTANQYVVLRMWNESTTNAVGTVELMQYKTETNDVADIPGQIYDLYHTGSLMGGQPVFGGLPVPNAALNIDLGQFGGAEWNRFRHSCGIVAVAGKVQVHTPG